MKSNYFERELRKEQICRNEAKKKLTGVCAGLADYFDKSPLFVRIVTLFLGYFFFTPVVIAYIVASIILPAEPDWKKSLKD